MHDRAERERRHLTPDEQQQWDASMREAQRLSLELEGADAELRSNGSNGSSGNPVEYRSPFAMTVNKDIETAVRPIAKGESRALSTAISTSPGELSTILFDRLRAASVVLGTRVRTLTTEADSVTYPALTADAAPAWTAEAAAITPSDPNSTPWSPRRGSWRARAGVERGARRRRPAAAQRAQ